MMKKLSFWIVFLFLVVGFQGCSSKKYFEPEEVLKNTYSVEKIEANIVQIHTSGATLSDKRFIYKEGLSSEYLESGYRFLNKNNQVYLSTNDQGSLAITHDGETQKISFDTNIVSATIENDLIALSFVDNSIVLYDRVEEKVVFKEYLSVSILNDIRITNPVFLTTLVLFPTLDGKIVIVDKEKKTIYRTINIDPQNDIRNIIYLAAIGDSLVAATPNKIFSFINGQVKIVDLEIKNVVVHKKNIFVSTLDGRVIKYDQNLNQLQSKKFKFAKFYAMVYGDGLYLLESQGYIIKIDNEFQNSTIMKLSFDEKEKVLGIDDTIYFEDSFIVFR